MGRSRIKIRVHSVAKAMKDRVSASPDIWDSSWRKDQDSLHHTEDVSAWLELPRDFRAPDDDGAPYRRSSTFDLSLTPDDFDESAWAVYE